MHIFTFKKWSTYDNLTLEKKSSTFSVILAIISLIVIIFTVIVLVYIGGKYFMFELPLIENAHAETGSEFFNKMVDKSYENPNKVFYYYETSDTAHGRVYTDSNGREVTEIQDNQASYVGRDCPSDKIVGSAISQGTMNGYVYTAIVQNGNFIDFGEGLTRATAAGKCISSGWGEQTSNSEKGGGCLIATATYGSELAPQVQQLRELRDNKLLNTESGKQFMGTFNDIYYSFSPIIADYERENPYFKEAVKLAITPMISSLSLMENAESESEVLGIGISVIMLNLGMYFGVPAVVVIGIRKRF